MVHNDVSSAAGSRREVTVEAQQWPDPATIPGVVERAARAFGAEEALVDGDRRLTFAELARSADELGRALLARGIGSGDRVAIWAPNGWRWVVAALGTYRTGATLVPVNTRFKAAEVGHVLRTARARLLFTPTRFLDADHLAALQAAGPLPDLSDVVLTDDTLPGLPGPATAGGAAGPYAVLTWAELLAGAGRVERSAAVAAATSPDDVSDIVFTSGTTGAPKGAMLTHGASVRAYQAWSSVVGLRRGDRYLIVYPFFHTAGLKSGMLACLLTGAAMLPQAVLDVPTVVATVAKERVTVLPGTPSVYQTILDSPAFAGADLSSLRLAVTGAATVPVEIVRRARDELGFETVVTGYGLTETTGVATMCRHDDDPETIARTCGRPIPGVELLLVDDSGREVTRGDQGEVLIRGYTLMRGYDGDPGGTAATVDAGGWLHTGDVGTLDPAGNLRITDRKKDMYVVGGFNAYPAEIEKMLTDHPAVGEVAVIGVPDRRLGEVGRAFVVPRAGRALDPDELLAWAREIMANYKVPRSVELVDELPHNATGKVRKDVLRARAAEGRRAGERPAS